MISTSWTESLIKTSWCHLKDNNMDQIKMILSKLSTSLILEVSSKWYKMGGHFTSSSSLTYSITKFPVCSTSLLKTFVHKWPLDGWLSVQPPVSFSRATYGPYCPCAASAWRLTRGPVRSEMFYSSVCRQNTSQPNPLNNICCQFSGGIPAVCAV